jgi:pyruvate dehydrogenase E2 component (dihydrolipoamide acetyltransferase)
VGDNVSEGTVIMQITADNGSVAVTTVPEITDASKSEDTAVDPKPLESGSEPLPEPSPGATTQPAPTPAAVPVAEPEIPGSPPPHASPGVRRFARELGADLTRITGSGAKNRILKDDVVAWVRLQLTKPAKSSKSAGSGIPPIPEVDFSQFGKIEIIRMSRIKRLSGPHLQRAWLNIPHVTHHDEADITELEEFRKSLKAEAEKDGVRITLLSFIMKALVGAMKKYPNVNASLATNGEELILKSYFNIGIAVDTPNGLVVPVVRDVDRKSIFDLARDMADISERSRTGKLTPDDLKGGCISISSLGGIGGTAFTPIVNAPEVAILGVSRSKIMPVWNGESFDPRLILPLDLSYDHRVIDGAEAARFVAYLTQSFGDVRRLSL